MPPQIDIECDARRNRSSMSAHFRLIPIAFLIVVSLGGCASSGERIDAQARAAGLSRATFAYAGLRSYIYLNAPPEAPDTLHVFLESDGVPWSRWGDAMQPSEDPTARRPLALELLARTPGRVAYITRPCYHELRDASCTSDRWTSGRYGEEIVAVMTAAIEDAARRAHASEVRLIGYSGGGALAVLIAERLTNVSTVITIAANLDIDAWTRHHGYLPLEQSLNPAASTRTHAWRELHFQGARDEEVPPATTSAYFERFPSAQREVIDEYDHACCWTQAWTQLQKK